jgi:hypothetical protein
MRHRANTKKQQRRRAAKLRPKAKPLRAGTSHVRRSPASTATPPLPLLMTERMGEVMAAYAELPARLLSARSPVEFWSEYFRFGTRLLSALQPRGPGVRAPKTSRVTRR